MINGSFHVEALQRAEATLGLPCMRHARLLHAQIPSGNAIGPHSATASASNPGAGSRVEPLPLATGLVRVLLPPADLDTIRGTLDPGCSSTDAHGVCRSVI